MGDHTARPSPGSPLASGLYTGLPESTFRAPRTSDKVRRDYKRHSSRDVPVRKNQSRDLSRLDDTAVSTTIFPSSFSVIFPVFRCSLRLCAFTRHDPFFSLVRCTHSSRKDRQGGQLNSVLFPGLSRTTLLKPCLSLFLTPLRLGKSLAELPNLDKQLAEQTQPVDPLPFHALDRRSFSYILGCA